MKKKYMISNGNKYISIPEKLKADSKNNDYLIVDAMYYAKRFTYQEALDFLYNTLGSAPNWGLRRVKKTASGKRYVITTGTNYVTNTCESGVTTNYDKVKWFKSQADAEAYMAKHHNFENPVIVDEDGCTIELSARKTFTKEQLKILGKSDEEKVSMRIAIPKTTRERVYENYNGKCAICGKPIKFDNFTIDHIIPLSRGGKNELSNFQSACEECNKLKGSRMDNEFAVGLANILSYQIIQKNNDNMDELYDLLIRSIVRNKINMIYNKQNIIEFKGDKNT